MFQNLKPELIEQMSPQMTASAAYAAMLRRRHSQGRRGLRFARRRLSPLTRQPLFMRRRSRRVIEGPINHTDPHFT